MEDNKAKIIKEVKFADNGVRSDRIARYEQHFADGSVMYSNTIPDHFAFKLEEEINVT
jgi:hypothetical protein